MQAKAYWQHAGEIISSRQAVEVLTALGLRAPAIWYQGKEVSSNLSRETSKVNDTVTEITLDQSESSIIVKNRIVAIALPDLYPSMTPLDIDSVLTITVSGMTAIFTTLRLFQAYSGMGKVVVFGFPYLDTLKVSFSSTCDS